VHLEAGLAAVPVLEAGPPAVIDSMFLHWKQVLSAVDAECCYP